MTWGWRDRLVAGAGALVLAASFLPWWTLRVRHGYGPPAQETFVTHDGNAWRMSTLWSVAGVLPDPDPDATTVRDWMARDHLRSYHDPGLYADVNWGLWVGLAAMVLVAVTIILAGRRHIAPVPG